MDRVTQGGELVTSKVVNLTPKLAKDLLSRPAGNRKVKKAVVQRYTEDILNGRWKMTGETISIDVTGRLLNGQHRCLSVIAANKSIPVIIVEGVDPDAMPHFDIGAKRTVSDTLQMLGEKETSRLGAAINMCLRYDRERYRNYNPSSPEQIAWLAENPNIRQWVDVAYKIKTNMVGTAIAATGYLTSRVDPEGAILFWELYDERRLESMPLQALSRWIEANVWKGGARTPTLIQFAIAMKAMNAHRAEEELRVLRFKDKGEKAEAMPRVWEGV